MIFLSYPINHNTPTYGNRDQIKFIKLSSIKQGAHANHTHIHMTSHGGTHVDMPYHFYENGQTIDSFDPSFWVFSTPLILEVNPSSSIIHEELMDSLTRVDQKELYDIIIVKTGQCYSRDTTEYGINNVGFSPEVADSIRSLFPNVRMFGFDSVSVSSFQERLIGREAHRRFLNPDQPIILLEDMDLRQVNCYTQISELIILPMRFENCDGIPVSILAKINKSANHN